MHSNIHNSSNSCGNGSNSKMQYSQNPTTHRTSLTRITSRAELDESPMTTARTNRPSSSSSSSAAIASSFAAAVVGLQKASPQQQQQQLDCAFCKRAAVSPISLFCHHFLCLTCAKFLKESESASQQLTSTRMSKHPSKIACPACSKTTVTTDLRSLSAKKKKSNSVSNTPCRLSSRRESLFQHQQPSTYNTISNNTTQNNNNNNNSHFSMNLQNSSINNNNNNNNNNNSHSSSSIHYVKDAFTGNSSAHAPHHIQHSSHPFMDEDDDTIMKSYRSKSRSVHSNQYTPATSSAANVNLLQNIDIDQSTTNRSGNSTTIAGSCSSNGNGNTTNNNDATSNNDHSQSTCSMSNANSLASLLQKRHSNGSMSYHQQHHNSLSQLNSFTQQQLSQLQYQQQQQQQQQQNDSSCDISYQRNIINQSNFSSINNNTSIAPRSAYSSRRSSNSLHSTNNLPVEGNSHYQNQLQLQQQQQQQQHHQQMQLLQQFQQQQQQLQLTCPQHKQPFTLFRISDKQLLCVECVYSQKKQLKMNSDIILLKDAWSILIKEKKSFESTCDSYLSTLQTSLNVNSQNHSNLQRDSLKLAEKVNGVFDGMIEIVNARRQKLLEILSDHLDTRYKEIADTEQALLRIKDSIEAFKQSTAASSDIMEQVASMKQIKASIERSQNGLEVKPSRIGLHLADSNSPKVFFTKFIEKSLCFVKDSKQSVLLSSSSSQSAASSQSQQSSQQTLSTQAQNQQGSQQQQQGVNQLSSARQKQVTLLKSESRQIQTNGSYGNNGSNTNNVGVSAAIPAVGNFLRDKSNNLSQSKVNSVGVSNNNYHNYSSAVSAGGTTSSNNNNNNITGISGIGGGMSCVDINMNNNNNHSNFASGIVEEGWPTSYRNIKVNLSQEFDSIRQQSQQQQQQQQPQQQQLLQGKENQRVKNATDGNNQVRVKELFSAEDPNLDIAATAVATSLTSAQSQQAMLLMMQANNLLQLRQSIVRQDALTPLDDNYKSFVVNHNSFHSIQDSRY